MSPLLEHNIYVRCTKADSGIYGFSFMNVTTNIAYVDLEVNENETKIEERQKILIEAIYYCCKSCEYYEVNHSKFYYFSYPYKFVDVDVKKDLYREYNYVDMLRRYKFYDIIIYIYIFLRLYFFPFYIYMFFIFVYLYIFFYLYIFTWM
ncbi:hypothetical protein WUBG_17967 [Wuchereria bancrofti]|uniref:Uncharacterized protein n=1 Tax=Wuchereria bancrofti TaxID=6293 RepID=J9AAZ7_WUCBA|nr:hypothetical protein WUBG_17967 [Wuchereria bancrofti]